MVLKMPSPSKNRYGVYNYRVRVPKDVSAAIGKQVIKETLRTKDPQEAKERFNERHAHYLKLWAAIRNGPIRLSQKQLTALAGLSYRKWLDALHENPGEPEIMQAARELFERIASNPDDLAKWYEQTVDELLADEGLFVLPESREALIKAMNKADIQAFGYLQKNAKGDYRPDPDAARFPAWEGVETAPQGKPQVSLWDLFDHWKRDHLANGRAPRTITDFEQKTRSFVEFLGHEDAGRVTAKKVSEWCDFLIHEKGLSSRTVKDKYLAAIKAIYRVGTGKHILDDNPAATVRVTTGKGRRTRSKGFTDAEALAILRHSLEAPEHLGGIASKTKQAIRWLPWICAYSGARAGEITQLRKEDLVHPLGIPTLRVTPEAGSVKTGELRLIPLHPHLIELGLVEFIQGEPEGYLFFTPRGPDDDPVSRSESVYKKVGAWVRKVVGIDDRRVAPNHGWRHRFKTVARDAGVDPEYTDAIMGHTDGRASVDYGEMTVKALHREISKIPRYNVSG